MAETISLHPQSTCSDNCNCPGIFPQCADNDPVNQSYNRTIKRKYNRTAFHPVWSRGACIWPLAVAEVCGGLPDDFNETTLEKNIAVGEEKLTFGQLFAIQLFPWLVGFIGIGAPIAYVIYQYRRARRAGRGANTADLEQSASVRQGGDSIVGEDAVPDIAPSLPEEIQTSITENEGNSQHSVGPHSGSGSASTGLTAQMLFELLIRQDRLTPTELRRTLNQHVANSDITMEEAKLIEAMVREEVVPFQGKIDLTRISHQAKMFQYFML